MPVASRAPNDYGLFDMLGNALQWCLDPEYDYPQTKPGADVEDIEFRGKIGGIDGKHVMRGGSFYNPESRLTSSYRFFYIPDVRAENFGFRIARTIAWNEQSKGNEHAGVGGSQNSRWSPGNE